MKKSTLFVVLLAAALGGAVWYFEFKRAKPAEDSATESKPLVNFKQEDVTGVTVQRGGERLALEKRGDAWHMTQPLDSAADGGNTDALVSSLIYGRVSRNISVPTGSAEALKNYGLDPPAATLEVKLKSGASQRLRLGAKDFTGSSVYAQVDDAKDVALVPEDILSNATKPVLEFRDRRILVFDEDNLTRLRVRNEHGNFVAAKNAEGKWMISEPVALRGKQAEVDRIISALRYLRAEEILDSPKPADRARLGRPAVEVELTSKDGSTAKAEFSSGKDDRLARSSIGPMLFKVLGSSLEALDFKPADVAKKEEPKTEEKPAEKPPTKKQD